MDELDIRKAGKAPWWYWAGQLVFLLLGLSLLLLCASVLYMSIKGHASNAKDDIPKIVDPVSELGPQVWPSPTDRTCNGDELVCLQVTTMLPNSTLQELANIPVPPGSTSHYRVRVSVTPIDE